MPPEVAVEAACDLDQRTKQAAMVLEVLEEEDVAQKAAAKEPPPSRE